MYYSDGSVDNWSNVSDASNVVMHEFVDDRFYGWKLKVTKAYEDKSNLQVMHFPANTSKYIIKGRKFVFIETPHKLNGIKCTVTRAIRKRKIKEKYLTEGWYDWVRANDLKEGDELRFQMDLDPSVVQVQIVRGKKHKSRK
ncbi:hypothetical protein A2U01_0022727 [Trifolium medium]|uniref:TF-B3 domain-containing protein n=1 Tax=Trifolium medium TaxID=97028 RepID=A0A392NR66_9FABA|nr:hypothetical protein [Trifolium medium]